MKIETCSTCSGTGDAPHPDAGVSRVCWACNGFGKRGRQGAYKTAALARRYGRTCTVCDGTGVTVWPDTTPCYDCSHSGTVVLDAHPGEVLPDAVGRCDSIPDAVSATLAAEWNVVVVREDRRQSWGEAFLGLGSVWSCTDYGTAWAATDDTVLAEKVRGELATGRVQWIKIITEARVIVPTIVVRLTRGGYSVVGAERDERGSLPPTYTDAVLSRPV